MGNAQGGVSGVKHGVDSTEIVAQAKSLFHKGDIASHAEAEDWIAAQMRERTAAFIRSRQTLAPRGVVVAMEGWVLKLATKRRGNWRRRYLRLSGTVAGGFTLAYAKSPAAAALREMNVLSATAVFHNSVREHCLCISNTGLGSDFFFALESDNEVRRWQAAIEVCAAIAKPSLLERDAGPPQPPPAFAMTDGPLAGLSPPPPPPPPPPPEMPRPSIPLGTAAVHGGRRVYNEVDPLEQGRESPVVIHFRPLQKKKTTTTTTTTTKATSRISRATRSRSRGASALGLDRLNSPRGEGVAEALRRKLEEKDKELERLRTQQQQQLQQHQHRQQQVPPPSELVKLETKLREQRAKLEQFQAHVRQAADVQDELRRAREEVTSLRSAASARSQLSGPSLEGLDRDEKVALLQRELDVIRRKERYLASMHPHLAFDKLFDPSMDGADAVAANHVAECNKKLSRLTEALDAITIRIKREHGLSPAQVPGRIRQIKYQLSLPGNKRTVPLEAEVEAELKLLTRVKAEMDRVNARLDQASAELERWIFAAESTPAAKARRAAAEAEERARQEPLNRAAFELVASFVPYLKQMLVPRNMPALESAYESAGLQPAAARVVAARLTKHRILRLLRQPPEQIAKQHPSQLIELSGKGLSPLERRALEHHLPHAQLQRFAKSGMNSIKAEWDARLTAAYREACVDGAGREDTSAGAMSVGPYVVRGPFPDFRRQFKVVVVREDMEALANAVAARKRGEHLGTGAKKLSKLRDSRFMAMLKRGVPASIIKSSIENDSGLAQPHRVSLVAELDLYVRRRQTKHPAGESGAEPASEQGAFAAALQARVMQRQKRKQARRKKEKQKRAQASAPRTTTTHRRLSAEGAELFNSIA